MFKDQTSISIRRVTKERFLSLANQLEFENGNSWDARINELLDFMSQHFDISEEKEREVVESG